MASGAYQTPFMGSNSSFSMLYCWLPVSTFTLVALRYEGTFNEGVSLTIRLEVEKKSDSPTHHFNPVHKPDEIRCRWNARRCFTVKSMYVLIRDGGVRDFLLLKVGTFQGLKWRSRVYRNFSVGTAAKGQLRGI
ncbi:hypothetical protein ACMD2_20247 [Ananas comosus]|uniref:Uncharacterized protein n=1 Tax=Ananas comosus TaxID=4615 RepID=A0A199UQ62_ANACO|nr:hypothetical protein ACMD2_20247 [Ananas comosus]